MREVERALYWLLAGTMGGINRVRILQSLLKKPQNTNQLAKSLHLDFKTIQYHLRVMEKNDLVTYQGGNGFPKIYFPSQLIEDNIEQFQSIAAQIENRKNGKEGKKV
jgi:predicted transcriptional regulator